MAFTEIEAAELTLTLEKHLWAYRRPPLHLREKIWEGQRFTGQSIELFYVRPSFMRPGEFTEEFIAKVTFVRSQAVWHLFWMRADGKWHRYPPYPEARSLVEALGVIHADAMCTFFG